MTPAKQDLLKKLKTAISKEPPGTGPDQTYPTSVRLFQEDLRRINAIKDLIYGANGARLNTSAAVRLALDAVDDAALLKRFASLVDTRQRRPSISLPSLREDKSR